MSELVAYLGTMNCMKSAMALMRAHKYGLEGESFIAFKPARDERDGEFIESRALSDKLHSNVIGEEERGAMFQLCALGKPEHVIVDEIQFMPEHQIEELAYIAKDLNIKVECYGLKVDFRSRLFEGSKRLIELADRIENIENDCSTTGCHLPATQNMRLHEGVPVFEGEVIQVGREETYRSVCLSCYLKAVKEVQNGK